MITKELMSFLQRHMGEKRKSLGMTKEEMASLVGMSVSEMEEFEGGEHFDVLSFLNVAAKLNIPFKENVLAVSEMESCIRVDNPEDMEPGTEFGLWTVLDFAKKDPKARHIYVLCECECGTIGFVQESKLRGLESTSCGCDRGEKQRLANMSRPVVVGKDLRGMRFGYLVVLDVEPRQTPDGHLEFFVHCDAPGCHSKDKWMRSDHITKAQSCGCLRGKKRKAPELAGQRFGFWEVMEDTRVNGKRTECLVRCVVCGDEKWVRAEQLRTHMRIACRKCTPKSLSGKTIGEYLVLGDEEKGEDKLPYIRCIDKRTGEEALILKENILRICADELHHQKK